jgi:hypothetical protein
MAPRGAICMKVLDGPAGPQAHFFAGSTLIASDSV